MAALRVLITITVMALQSITCEVLYQRIDLLLYIFYHMYPCSPVVIKIRVLHLALWHYDPIYLIVIYRMQHLLQL